MSEEWRPVRRYEGYYEVSNLGSVRRVKGGRGATAGRLLRLKLPNKTNDYCRVQLCKHDQKRTFGIHALVAEAFIGKRPRKKFRNHKDLNKTNNCADNLEWLTNRQNTLHAIANGRQQNRPAPGEQNGRAKLTEQQVKLIRKLQGKVGQRELAVLCGVCKSTIQFIHQGKHWIGTQPDQPLRSGRKPAERAEGSPSGPA